MKILRPTTIPDEQKCYFRKAKISLQQTVEKMTEQNKQTKESKQITHVYIINYQHHSGFKPFHVIAKPIKIPLNINNRLWFCNYLQYWDKDNFIQFVPSDEFLICTVRQPNHHNYPIWATSLSETETGNTTRSC